MRRGRVGRLLAWLGLAVLAWSGSAAGARAQQQGCATCAQPCEGGVCQRTHCPPAFHHCQEQPPCIRIHCGCPRPVCNPCNLPNFGYFQTCWTPWPLPPDWSHCKVPPPAAFVQLQGPMAVPGVPSTAPLRQPIAAPGAVTPAPLPPGNVTPEITIPPTETELPRPAPFLQPGSKG